MVGGDNLHLCLLGSGTQKKHGVTQFNSDQDPEVGITVPCFCDERWIPLWEFKVLTPVI